MQEQRYLPALRAHIDQLLREGWVIVQRDPIRLQFAGRSCLVMHGMLISEGPLWNHAEAERLFSTQPPQQHSRQTSAASVTELAAVAG
ncbi:MAG: hypothetical protein R3355_04270 [Pseudomonas sp.]|uniref:hypothetical protein n=1 Tax=Pseudomonas sp. TaxID=306 RepID=UPI00299D9699|nr:hypothetical protein [Pseudomonas sp.]MDX1722313.1 hypothetical protein [Pseudomonas sp.]